VARPTRCLSSAPCGIFHLVAPVGVNVALNPMPSRIENRKIDAPANDLVQVILWFWGILTVAGVLLLAGSSFFSWPYSSIAIVLGLVFISGPFYCYLSVSVDNLLARTVAALPRPVGVITAVVVIMLIAYDVWVIWFQKP